MSINSFLTTYNINTLRTISLLRKGPLVLFFFLYLMYTTSMTFTTRLMDWYQSHKRTLPFRSQKNPYYIWVSEVMAQQTQIGTMLPYYESWIASFPTIEALANADIDTVLKHWEGLGYYNRARNLHKGAQKIVSDFDGIMPCSKADLLTIPGIGDYTASAIASIAFGLPEITIDGNVKRVMARYLNYTESVNTVKAHRAFESFLKARLLESEVDPGDFNQALMELGALVCTPSNVTCIGCPFKEMCACYRGEVVQPVPFIPKAKKGPTYYLDALIVIHNRSILLQIDHDDTLMPGLYRLPQMSRTIDTEPEFTLIHKFSHLTWDIYVHHSDDLTLSGLWIPLDTLKQVSIVTAHRKILKHFGHL